MSEPSNIAYVVACYFGDRRVNDYIYHNENRYDYIEWQIKQLQLLKTTLVDKIIFVLSGCAEVPSDLNIPERINNIPVDVLVRENIGLSYGAWNFAVNQYGHEFNYYFLIEDDYIPVMDFWDSAFMDRMADNVAYVCTLFTDHVAVSYGLFRTSAILKTGGVKHASNSEYGSNETAGQIQWGQNLQSHGWKIVDVAKEYNIPFLNYLNAIVDCGKIGGSKILSPVYCERMQT